jgi:pentapeptide MXKDX repeat protein
MTISTRVARAASAAVLSFGLAFAPAAFAQDKMGDGMKKEEGMKKEGGMMKKDDGMKKEGGMMKKDDGMKKEGGMMKKEDTK